jgi:CspA family cold shock protein
MTKISVELVKYDMDKTKKRKRANFFVETKSEEAVIEKLEKIHKGEKVEKIQEIIWGEQVAEVNANINVLTGTVKFYDDVKGFGFIQPDSDLDDLFFHASALEGIVINDEDKIQFEVAKGPRGDIAIHIKLRD